MGLSHGELFAGIGGFSVGFEAAGIETAWQVEINPAAQKVLKVHYPNILLLGDVRECGAHNLGHVDVITFGSPCQDLSISGKREGLSGTRSGLFFEAIRIVDELHPTFAVWENVTGALSSNAGRDFAIVLAAFRDCGARDIAWRTLDAAGFGVPQHRRRVFVVADFVGERAGEVLFERERSTWDITAGEGEGDPNSAPTYTSADGSIEFYETDRCTGTFNTRSGDQAGQGLADVCFPIRIRGKWRIRKFTPLEVERLCGFADEWTIGTDSDRYEMLGNCASPAVTRWLGERLLTST
jgi:site-specific DNA-cytosine methylase